MRYLKSAQKNYQTVLFATIGDTAICHNAQLRAALLVCASLLFVGCSGSNNADDPVIQANEIESSSTAGESDISAGSNDDLANGDFGDVLPQDTDDADSLLQDETVVSDDSDGSTSSDDLNTETDTSETTDAGISNDTDGQLPNTDNSENGDGDADGSATSGNTGNENNVAAQITATGFDLLPNPPITAAPRSIDEPVAVDHPFSTVTEITLVRDPGSALPRDASEDITEADFNAGPLPAVITVPEGVDPEENSAPFFVDLNDVTVFAGEELRLLLEPEDADDIGWTGMFTESRPDGSRMVDNFDTTKTLVWTPLQPDVGIHEFHVTAIDFQNGQYQTRRTVRIKVVLPEDTSGIQNFAPGLNYVRPHVVRVNDPVNIKIRVTDPNGTIPNLEVLNQPPGAVLEPDPQLDDVSILRFIPTVPGLIQLTAVATDSEDPTSSVDLGISIDVREASDFVLPGRRIRDLASSRGFKFGYASLKDFYDRPDGALYADLAAAEFDFVTTENSLKWVFTNPIPGRYRWASADNLVSFAKAHGMEIHGHTLVWYNALPGWVKTSAVEDREGIMREYIDRVLTRYADDIPLWDVVNEAFENDGTYRYSTWFEAMGESHIDIAFEQARASAPNARLIYNDYDVAWAGPKADAMFTMLEEQLEKGTPIDGVGFQMHLESDFNLFSEVEANFQRAANLGLDIYITEFDVSEVSGFTLEGQAEIYRRVLDVCLNQPNCKGFQTWGFSDMYTWRGGRSPLLLDEQYGPKPAYLAVQERLTED